MQEREAKKEAFRKYLESSGVLDALTKGFHLSSLGLFCFSKLVKIFGNHYYC